MSDSMEPMEPAETVVHTPTSEGLGRQFVEKELRESKASLVRTQVIGSILALGTLAYMWWLTSSLRSNMEPHNAAQIVTGLATQRVDDLVPQVTSYVREQVPQMIQRAPDELIARLPEYRQTLEQRVEADLKTQANANSEQLGKSLDAFLQDNQAQISSMLVGAQDPKVTQEMGEKLEARFHDFLTQQEVGGSTLQARLDNTLSALKQVEQRTSQLAANKGLSPSEQKARRAIAILMRRIDAAKASGGVTLQPINVEKVQQATEQATERVQAAAENLSQGKRP